MKKKHKEEEERLEKQITYLKEHMLKNVDEVKENIEEQKQEHTAAAMLAQTAFVSNLTSEFIDDVTPIVGGASYAATRARRLAATT